MGNSPYMRYRALMVMESVYIQLQGSQVDHVA